MAGINSNNIATQPHPIKKEEQEKNIGKQRGGGTRKRITKKTNVIDTFVKKKKKEIFKEKQRRYQGYLYNRFISSSTRTDFSKISM